MQFIISFWIFIQYFIGIHAQPVEEFLVRGPDQLHSIAINTFLDERRKNPEVKDLGDNSPIMIRAKQHAIKRFSVLDDSELTLTKPVIGTDSESPDSPTLLALPSPDGQQDYLTAAVTNRATAAELMPAEDLHALQAGISEDIGFGAISKAGALPMGDGMKWLKFVEDKLKRDNRIDHQSLLWELGSEVAEMEYIQGGGLNVSLEEELLRNLSTWFETGGGKLRYVKPSVNKETGITLHAMEDIEAGEAVIQIPIKLTMCRISARNVLIKSKGKYLGEELKKTFEKNEVWALAVFLLHEYYKEMAGSGSKWGPYLRTLRMRSLSTPSIRALQHTRAVELTKNWMKSANDLRFWSTGVDGPCSPTTQICTTKPNDKFANQRFENHHMRWAYWVVKQNAVRVQHTSTGQSFLALIPYFNLIEKRVDSGGGVTFDLDGGISIRVGSAHEDGQLIGTHPGNFTDTEFFLRYMTVPKDLNPYNSLPLTLPGSLPEGSDYHLCLKMIDKDKDRKCKGDKGQDLMWKMKTLSEWRKAMNLPPRMGDLRLWATRLHLYGDDEEEQKKLSSANQLLAGLPVSTDDIPAEDQLMLLGIVESNEEAMAMVAGGQARPPPQLYSAPDPEEDPEAQKAMEQLATLAAQVHMVVSSGNVMLNATRAVLNQTRDFFQHGVMPKAGLDELDEFILKKIGMLAHCGVDKAMKIVHGNISKELMCAMRVHLMNESEMNVFCPAEAKVFHENCQNVEFMNYTAISLNNELNVIEAFRNTLNNLLAAYPTTVEEDREIIARETHCVDCEYGSIFIGAVRLRLREKELLLATLDYLKNHEEEAINGDIPFQLEIKRKEREEADLREAEHQKFMEEIRQRAAEKKPLAVVPVELGGDKPKQNLTLLEGNDLKETVATFCRQHNIPQSYLATLENALKKQIVNPIPLHLLMGVVTPTGDRQILGIPEGTNSSIETGVFCIRYGMEKEGECEKLQHRVDDRITGQHGKYIRRILGNINVDAPDGRKLTFVVREGEQHDIGQFTSDFLLFYKMYSPNAVNILGNEMLKRLPAPVLKLPVGLSQQKTVEIRFAQGENITSVIEGFMDFYELADENVKTQILRLAQRGLHPGTFMV